MSRSFKEMVMSWIDESVDTWSAVTWEIVAQRPVELNKLDEPFELEEVL